MDLSALHGNRLWAAAVFVAATLVLAVQLITPSPVVVSVGDAGAQTARLGEYFTYSDVGIITVAASVLGASGTYLLVYDHPATESSSSRRSSATTGDSVAGDAAPAALDGGTTSVDSQRRRAEWEETADRLHNHEQTVYTLVLDADGELPQRDIVEGTDLSKATVSRTLDTLESKGLVERKRRGMGNLVVLQ